MKWRRPKRSGNLNRHVEVEKYKIFNSHCSCTGRSSFFSERVTDIWNSLPSYVVDISSLASFKRSVNSVNFFSKYVVDFIHVVFCCIFSSFSFLRAAASASALDPCCLARSVFVVPVVYLY